MSKSFRKVDISECFPVKAFGIGTLMSPFWGCNAIVSSGRGGDGLLGGGGVGVLRGGDGGSTGIGDGSLTGSFPLMV